MTIYFLLYGIILTLLLLILIISYLKNKKYLYSKFFFLSILSIFLWLFLYFISFITTYDKEILLYYSRFMYGLAILSMYSMLFFVYYFKEKKIKHLYKIYTILAILFFISSLTPYIIENMLYDDIKKIYYESYGSLYYGYLFLYLFFIPIFFIFLYLKNKKIKNIDKIRLNFISIGFIIFMLLEIIFLSVMPVFGFRLFEKEQILFFIPFILSFFYVSHRYKFTNIKILISSIINFGISFLLSLTLLNSLKLYFLILDPRLTYFFWDVDTKFQIPDLFLGISLFLIFYNIFKKYIFGNNEYIFFIKEIGKLKNKISFISDFNLLNKFLNTELANLFKTKYIAIKLYENGNLEGLKEYFLKDNSNNLFINDIVFIEENKHKFDFDLISKEISENVYLVFPLINNNGTFLGILETGIRNFGDIYYSQEIDLLRDFSQSLIIQLKHIEIYKEIQDINIHLDKKIDEKTIEYNNLLNKQKDFISMISHEIKSPLGACIFQVDSIIDDIKLEKYDKKYLLSELEILNKYLINIGDLTKTMFSVEKYDLSKIQLFKQKVDINFLIYEKIEFYKKSNKKIEFIIDIKDDIGYLNIDKIQFSQVLDNLFVNAIKFISKEKPKIFIKTFIVENNFVFEIEDNGKGFDGINPSVIFDKYVTGISSSIGIGMGMYLCKKIVELHNGNIKANNANVLTGANFKIEIPLNID